jgi:hypothetical protein
MRIILKIIAAPFMVVLTIMVAVLIFLFAYSEQILNLASGLLALIGIALMVFLREWVGGGVFLGLAFLASPVGLPAIASWLIEKLDDLKYSLRDFITS